MKSCLEQMKEYAKYADYSFEDFLQDDFFMESHKRPTEESVAFWKQFLEDYPQQADTCRAAGRFFEDLVHSRMSDEEVDEGWSKILIKYERARGRRMIRYAAAAIAVAASITLLLAVRGFFDRQDDGLGRDDIMLFVGNQVDSLLVGEEVQLILSEQKTVYLQGEKSVIQYDSASIRTDSEQIAKEEIAAFNQLVVPYGKSAMLTLLDGTKIWVNAGTKLVYPVEFEKGKREIYVNGEIFLDVAADAQRPFIVRTNDLRVQVVGTKFNVQAYASDEHSRIALESGLVKILSEATGDVMLSPNKVYEQDKSGHSSVKDADIEKYTSWVHGLYMYESERLDVILKRLERYYGIEIVVDSSASGLRCSGKLDLKENVEDVLSIIGKTAPVDCIKESERYAVSYQPKKLKPMSP